MKYFITSIAASALLTSCGINEEVERHNKEQINLHTDPIGKAIVVASQNISQSLFTSAFILGMAFMFKSSK